MVTFLFFVYKSTFIIMQKCYSFDGDNMFKKIINSLLISIYVISSILLLNKIYIIISMTELVVAIFLVFSIGLMFYLLLKNNILNVLPHIGIFFISLMFLSFNTTSKTVFEFVDEVVTNVNIIDNYRVIVLKDKYSTINELENKHVGYTKDTIGISNIEISFSNICYETLEKMLLALDDGDIEAGLILQEQYDELSNKEDYQIIYRLSIEEKIENVNKDLLNETVLIYVSGMDSYAPLSNTGRSDVNMIIGINAKTNQILLISIPRDYYVELADKNAMDKLTHAGIYGINTSIKTVENLLNVDIDYYIKINFASLENLIDKLGGIEVDSDVSFVSGGIEFVKGKNYLNGSEALVFSRKRKGLVGGDRTRGENQQRVIEGIVNKLSEKKALSDYVALFDSLKQSFQTNIPEAEIYKMVKRQLIKSPDWKVIKHSLNGSDSYAYTYSYKCCKLYVMEPYQETIDEAITLIEYLKTGGIFN